VLHPAECTAALFFVAVLAGNSTNIKWHEGGVTTQQKEDMLEQKGCVLWFTGLSGSGTAA
jgi:adenylylsulfate kinase